MVSTTMGYFNNTINAYKHIFYVYQTAVLSVKLTLFIAMLF